MRRLKLFGLTLALLFVLPYSATLSVERQGSGGATSAASAKAKKPARKLSNATLKAAELITAEQLKKDLYWVADDARGGRDTPSEGLNETAEWIAARLKAAKVAPGGDNGTYFQKIDLTGTSVDAERTRGEFAGKELRFGTDFVLGNYVNSDVSGQIVYVGHGWVVRSKKIDAYSGLDVKDKIVVVSGNGTAPPPGVSAEYIASQPSEDWESPLSYARKNGARAVLTIPRRYEDVWTRKQNSIGKKFYRVNRLEEVESNAGALPVLIPSMRMVSALFAGETTSAADIIRASSARSSATLAGFALSPEKRLSVSTSVKTEKAYTQNVVGILKGADSKLKNEYVAVGAHYDHVGSDPNQKGDQIFNGADDDGSGTVAVLSMAEAFAKSKRPKRSVIFVWHAGEEHGLWGSEYFVKYPPVPVKQIVAQINIDMIGRSKSPEDKKTVNQMLTGPEEIYVIGSRMMSSDLGELTETANQSYLNLKYNYHYDKPNDPERLFYRSDHYNYAVQGIPVVFFFDGIHEDYHRPSDHPDKIDYQKLEKVTRTIFVLTSEIANAPVRPAVDKALAAERRR